ncbi:DNA-binding transcriptional regulator, LacI/PurR family [Micromonospora pallida]|uniref:DNA-binding transcriptional regulator, LacI/PurR family n=1 Tax=Micromonospora pallida TaxID=145854 RepID=A0A1C6SHF2_9ACTN|nr:LacI family DNA-binding transcriptional regulator [Micromonospora pallida]SCL28924.1 DNA-binding transcriptional regulator, LacI/PurR family [Micromonospora pallida]
MAGDASLPGPRPGRRVTSADVARASGVSRATVSYVLNNVANKSVSESTRQLVLATAQRLGHIPYAPARSLRLGRSDIVLALVRDLTYGYIHDRVLEVLDVALARRGFVLLIHRYSEQVRPLSELWPMVAPALVVSMGGLSVPEMSSIQDSRAKLVGVQGLFPHERAGEMQVEYLHSRGHRRIGYAFPANPSVELIAAERLAGARRACARLGIPEPVLQEVDLNDGDTVFAALDAWAAAPEAITGVCAHNDDIALMLSSGLTARGLRAGTDLAVIGVDNIPLARIGITTVEINADAFADQIVQSVLDTLDDRVAEPKQRELLRLIVRDSA